MLFQKSIWDRGGDPSSRKQLRRKHALTQGLGESLVTRFLNRELKAQNRGLIPIEKLSGGEASFASLVFAYYFEHGFLDIGQDPYGAWCSDAVKAKIEAMAASPLEVDVNRYPADESPFVREPVTGVYDFDLQPPCARSGHGIAFLQGQFARVPVNLTTFSITTYDPNYTNSGLFRMYYSGSGAVASDVDRPFQLGVLQIGSEVNLKWVLVLIRDNGEVIVWKTGFLPGGDQYRNAIIDKWATMDELERRIRKTELMGLIVPLESGSIVREAGGISGAVRFHTWAYSREDCTQGAHACIWTQENLEGGPPHNTLRVYEMTLTLNDQENISAPASWMISLDIVDSGTWVGFGDAGEKTSAQVMGSSRQADVTRILGGDLSITHGGDAAIACWYDLDDNLVVVPITGTPVDVVGYEEQDIDSDSCNIPRTKISQLAGTTEEYQFSVGTYSGEYFKPPAITYTNNYTDGGSDPGEVEVGIGNGTLFKCKPSAGYCTEYSSSDPRWCSIGSFSGEWRYTARTDKKLVQVELTNSGHDWVKDGLAIIIAQTLREGVWLAKRENAYNTNSSYEVLKTKERYGYPTMTRFYKIEGSTLLLQGSTNAIWRYDVENASRAADTISTSTAMRYSNQREVAEFYGNVLVNIADKSVAIGEDLDSTWENYCYRSYSLGILVPRIRPSGQVSAFGEYAFSKTGASSFPELLTSSGWPEPQPDNTFRNVIPIGGV